MMALNEKRGGRRVSMGSEAVIHADGKLITTCLVKDVSSGGARIVLGEEIDVPAEFTLTLTRNGKVGRRCRVVWRLERELGAKFR
jgi:hypothetical protein